MGTLPGGMMGPTKFQKLPSLPLSYGLLSKRYSSLFNRFSLLFIVFLIAPLRCQDPPATNPSNGAMVEQEGEPIMKTPFNSGVAVRRYIDKCFVTEFKFLKTTIPVMDYAAQVSMFYFELEKLWKQIETGLRPVPPGTVIQSIQETQNKKRRSLPVTNTASESAEDSTDKVDIPENPGQSETAIVSQVAGVSANSEASNHQISRNSAVDTDDTEIATVPVIDVNNRMLTLTAYNNVKLTLMGPQQKLLSKFSNDLVAMMDKADKILQPFKSLKFSLFSGGENAENKIKNEVKSIQNAQPLDANWFEQTKNTLTNILEKTLTLPAVDQVTNKVHTIFKFNTSTISDILFYGTTVITKINAHLEKVTDLLDKLNQNKLPNSAFDLNALDKELDLICNQPDAALNKEELLYALQEGRFTFPYKSCPPEPCNLEVYLTIPILKTDYQYEHGKVFSVPTFHKGVLFNDWKQIKPTVSEFLKRNASIIPTSVDEIDCQEFKGELPCSLCIKPSFKYKPVGQCLKDIIKGNDPWVHCPSSKLQQSADETVRLNSTTWLYSDAHPGSVVETCGTMVPRKHSLHNSGLLTTKPGCAYTISNGPWQQEEFNSPSVTIIDTQNDELRESFLEDGLENSVLGVHLKDNSFSYFIALLSLSGTTILVFSCYCYMQRGRIRIRVPLFPRRARVQNVAQVPGGDVHAMQRLVRANAI